MSTDIIDKYPEDDEYDVEKECAEWRRTAVDSVNELRITRQRAESAEARANAIARLSEGVTSQLKEQIADLESKNAAQAAEIAKWKDEYKITYSQPDYLAAFMELCALQIDTIRKLAETEPEDENEGVGK